MFQASSRKKNPLSRRGVIGAAGAVAAAAAVTPSLSPDVTNESLDDV
ncbi:twin-arginine translocation signal domain-containing protein [Streptomyces sp. NPDC052023]